MMKRTKSALIMLILSIVIALLPTTTIHADAAVPDQLIVLPTGKYDTTEATAMIHNLEKIPTSVLQKLVSQGVKIKLTNDIITNEPELKYLKGVTPRGWEGTGLTWDDVPGVSENIVVVRIGYSQKGQGHDSFNLEIHETMHAVDRFVFDSVSDSQAFKDVFTKEAALNYDDNYVSVYPAEYFAESASLYLYSDSSRAALQKTAPLTYTFMDKLFH